MGCDVFNRTMSELLQVEDAELVSTIFRLNLPYVSLSKLLHHLCRADKAW